MKKLLAIGLGCAIFAATPAWPQSDLDLVDKMLSSNVFDKLMSALTESGVTFDLKRSGPYTLFAPTNEAFEKLPAGRYQQMLENKDNLRRLLLSHVVRGRIKAEDCVRLKSLKTLAGGTIKFENVNGHGLIGGAAHFSIANVPARNGYIQGIDAVLTPSSDTPNSVPR